MILGIYDRGLRHRSKGSWAIRYLKIWFRNALGQSLLLKLTKSHLLENVAPGEHVTVVVNDKHEIVKLIATPIPELPPGHIPGQ